MERRSEEGMKGVEIKARVSNGGKMESFESVPDLVFALKNTLPHKVHVVIKGGGMATEEYFDRGFYGSEIDRLKLVSILQSQVDRCIAKLSEQRGD